MYKSVSLEPSLSLSGDYPTNDRLQKVLFELSKHFHWKLPSLNSWADNCQNTRSLTILSYLFNNKHAERALYLFLLYEMILSALGPHECKISVDNDDIQD